jgi:hypothetical protein
MSYLFRPPPPQRILHKLRRRPWSDPPAIVPARNYDFLGSPSIPTLDLTHSRADSAPVATYFDSSGVLQTAAAGAPRFDNQYVGTGWRPRGLLLERSSKNLFQYNLDLSTGVTAAATTLTGGILGSKITAPDGTATSMCLFTEDTSTGAHAITQIVSKGAAGSAAINVTVSAILKDNGRGCLIYVQNIAGTAGAYASFDVLTGTIVPAQFGATGWAWKSNKITPIGNGEFIIQLSFLTDANDSTFWLGFYGDSTHTGTTSYAGNGTSGFYLWGVNVEQGLNRTSLIKNSGATLNTRPADIVTLAGSPLTVMQGATLSVLIEAELNLDDPTTNPVILSDGTEEYQLFVDVATPDQAVSLWETDAIRASAVATFGGWSTTGRVFYAQDGSGHAISMNGGPTATSTYVPVVARTSVQIGSPPISIATQHATGWYKRLAFYTTRPTNAQIQALSGVGVPTQIGGTSYLGTVSFGVSPAVGTTTGTTKTTTAAATLSFANAMAAIGGISYQSSITLALTTGNSASAVLVASASAALAVSNAITTTGLLNLTGQASLAVHPVITPASFNLMNVSATLGFSSAIAALGSISYTASMSLAVAMATAAVASLTFNLSASLAVTTGLSASAINTMLGSASLAVSAGLAASSTRITTNAVTLAASFAIAAAGTENINASAALATALSLSATGATSMSLSASLAAAFGLSATATETLTATMSLAIATGLSAIGSKSYTDSISFAVHPALAAVGQEVLSLSATLNFSPALAAAAKTVINASASLNVHPDVAASTGGLTFDFLTFAVTTSVVANAALNLTGRGTLAASFTSSAQAQETINAAATLVAAFGLSASIGGTSYTDALTLAVTAALSASVKMDAQAQAQLAATVTQLVQSTDVMQAAVSLAASMATAAIGALSFSASAAFSTSVQTSASGALTVLGSIGLGANQQIGGTVSAELRPQLSFSATFTSETADLLTVNEAINLATQVALSVILDTGFPAVEMISARGVWQGEVDLAGIFEAMAPLGGLYDLSPKLAGVYDLNPSLLGVVQLTIETG